MFACLLGGVLTVIWQEVIKTAEHRRRQLERVEPTFKENKRLLAEVRALGDEVAELKEEQSKLQARVYQQQLEKKDLAIERDMARDDLITAQEQLGETGTWLAIVAEQKNCKTLSFTTSL